MIPSYVIRIYRLFLFRLMPKFALMLMKAVPVTLEIYFHHSFGERYLWRLITGVGVFYAYAVPSAELAAPASRPLLTLFLIGLIVLSLVHFFHLPVRRHRGVVISSQSYGLPWPIWQRRFSLHPTTTIRYVEPMVAMGIGLVLSPIDYDLASWFIFSSTALFIKGQIERFSLHQLLLDTLDGRVDARMQQDAVNDYQTPPHQEGFHRVRPHRERDRSQS